MPEDELWDIVVVGAGIAGLSAVKGVRRVSPDASVCLVNGEARLPYKRTKISKNIASGFARDAFALADSDWFMATAVHVLEGVRAVRLDPTVHSLETDSGATLHWSKLVLATGAQARRTGLVRESDEGAFVVRCAADAERLTAFLPRASRVLVLGMGVLGVEVAEQLCVAGKAVTVVHRGPAMMERELTARSAAALRALFEQHGVELVFNTSLTRVDVEADGTFRTEIGGGVRTFDAVVECTGSVPDTGLAREAGLATERGIVVNEYLQTSCPDVYAAGDAVSFPGHGVTHLWHAAETQGLQAGANAAGEVTPYDARPYRLKCEVFGGYLFSMNRPRPDAPDVERVERERDGVYECLYLRDGAVDGVVMAGDKEHAKVYERAVWEGWPLAQLDETLA